MINLFKIFRSPQEEEIEGGGKQFSVMNDRIFKKMLASNNEDSRQALRSLLCACTGRGVSSVKVIGNEILPSFLGGKLANLDVTVKFNDGEVADLEMQIAKSDDDLKSRASFYAARLQSGQLKQGSRYRDIKRVYQIFFLNCILFPHSSKLPRRYSYMEEKEHDRLTDKVEIVIYEMPKLERQVEDYLAGKSGMETLSDEEKWCIFFKYRHEERAQPLIKELCRKEEGIMRAEKALGELSRSQIKYYRDWMREKRQINIELIKEAAISEAKAEGRTQGLEEGREEGRTQGREEGLAEGQREKLQIARNLLAKGSTPEFVAEITGLDLETIKELRN